MDVEERSGGGGSLPPWNNPQLLNEAGLKDAREYFFQTHATHSRMIAEGRNATGFMKSHIRRKLNKEMGEDFKMYTGQNIGEGDQSEESKGIRGELNDLLGTIYRKISPGVKAASPILEDLAILQHPLGALEVCFGMVCYYSGLMQRFASLASNRRKMLKSVMDEELFKWTWRMYFALTMGGIKKISFQDNIPSNGLKYVPVEKERLSSSDKIIEIGEFLLGSVMSSSHLRFPICYYFVYYIRQIQFKQLLDIDRNKLDEIFEQARGHKENTHSEHVLVAVDWLMNMKGNSQHAFDDVLKEEEVEAQKFIPQEEIEFMENHMEFSRGKVTVSLKKFLPQSNREESTESQGASLMPVLMLLRSLPYATGEKIMDKIPGPALTLLKNRISHGNQDITGKSLLDRLEETINAKLQKGETYGLYHGKGSAMVQSVKAAPRHTGGDQALESGVPADPYEEKAAKPKARPDASREERPKASRPRPAASGQEQKVALEKSGVIDERAVLTWNTAGGGLKFTCLAPREIILLTGSDPRFVVPWVLFALQTGQVLRIPPDKVSKETIEKIIRSIAAGAGGAEASLTNEEKSELHKECRGLPPQKVLMHMVKRFQIGSMNVGSGSAMADGLNKLAGKLGDKLGDFMKNPKKEAYLPTLKSLTPPEKYALSVLNKVARLQ